MRWCIAVGRSERSPCAVGLVAAGAGAAQAAPRPENRDVVVVNCDVGEGLPREPIAVIPQGAIAFVLDEQGDPTGQKLHVLSIDAAAFDPQGQVVSEFHKQYGERAGFREVRSCDGTAPLDEPPGTLLFFDVLVASK